MLGVQTVALVGRDAPLWLSAAAIQRALGRTGVRVLAVEIHSRLASVDAYAALPSLASLHRLLGLDERAALGACAAVPVVAQRFSNFAKNAPPFFIAYDDEPPPGGDLPFTQYWIKAALAGLRLGLDEFSLGVACAKLNTIPLAPSAPTSMSASYGYHLDARAYSELVRQFALRSGVELVAGGVRHVAVEGNWIGGIDLEDGSQLVADLYVDASGPEGRLISQLEDSRFESWSGTLGCDRLLAASARRLPQLPSFGQISAFKGGFVALYPLQNRTAIVAAFKSGALTDREAVEQTQVIARMPIEGNAVVTELRPGIQKTPWLGNCVAVGEAAFVPAPTDAVDLRTTHACLSYLMTTFPATAGEFPEAEAYNRSVRSLSSRLRDFQAAHFLLNRRFDDPLWDGLRETELPPGLKRKSDLFRARGIVPLDDDETFGDQPWEALLLGSGVMPQGYDPRVDAVPADVHLEKVQQRLREVAAKARSMPSVEQFLDLDATSAAGVIG